MPGIRQQGVENLGKRHGTADEVALKLITPMLQQPFTLLVIFHPLSNHLQSKAVGKPNDRGAYQCLAVIQGNLANECAIELNYVSRQKVQVRERIEACTEVIDGYVDTHVAENCEALPPMGGVVNQRGFGDFDANTIWSEAMQLTDFQ